MSDTPQPTARPLRILYLEDNPLIVFHVEQLIEEMGHTLVASLDSFSGLKDWLGQREFDAALIDTDRAGGPTGPLAASWLGERGVPALFITGQELLARQYEHLGMGTIAKPIQADLLKAGVEVLSPIQSRQ